MSMVPSGCRVILSGTPSGKASMSCRKVSMAAKTLGSNTSPRMSRLAGSPSSANRSAISSTPIAKSERSSRKSSTAKSPSNWAIPMAAGTVIMTATRAIIAAVFRWPDPRVTPFNHSGLTMDLISLWLVLVFRASSQSSTLTRINGAHKPVKMKAANTPSAASIPKERRAAMSLKRLAAKAAMVVRDVRVMARPTRDKVMLPASSEVLPLARSSL